MTFLDPLNLSCMISKCGHLIRLSTVFLGVQNDHSD